MQNDPANCGECNLDCGLGYICTDGACACARNADRCEDYCTDIDVDVYNCGRCGNECPIDIACQARRCGECESDWWFGEPCNGACVVCDGMADVAEAEGFDRVCALTTMDRWNCGRCGNECVEPTECQNGQCDCLFEWWNNAECNGACVVCGGMEDVVGFDRVCTLTATDNYNCGQCGNPCPESQECQNSQCVCEQEWTIGAECNGVCVVCNGMVDVIGTDSVCTLTATDPYNCGECGNWCMPPDQCNQGRCEP